jgi:ribosomal protein S12 methylthiotransferase accessory factor
MVSQIPQNPNDWPVRTPLQRDMQRWCTSATIAEHPYLAPDVGQQPRTRQDYPRRWGEDLRDDIQCVVGILQQQHIETLVLDQTRPDVGLNVVRVMAPGLRHFWVRLAPGRLYDVPVRLGWLQTPLSEELLNPTAMFL